MAHTHPEDNGSKCGSAGEESNQVLSDREKLTRMVEHWIHHNGDHERSYRDWALRAKRIGIDEVGLLLEKAADDVGIQNRGLQRVLDLLKVDPTSR